MLNKLFGKMKHNLKQILLIFVIDDTPQCHNLSLRECENETHTLEMGTWESFGTPKS
jgi:hypothetical protein